MQVDGLSHFLSRRWAVIVAAAGWTAVSSAVVMMIIVAVRDRLGKYAPLLFISPFALVAIGIAALIALVLLRPTQLRLSIPIVAGLTVTFTAIGSLSHPFDGAFYGLLGGILVMLAVALVPALREPLPERRRLSAPV